MPTVALTISHTHIRLVNTLSSHDTRRTHIRRAITAIVIAITIIRDTCINMHMHTIITTRITRHTRRHATQTSAGLHHTNTIAQRMHATTR